MPDETPHAEQGSTPRPDPTILTTQQLDRGLDNLEKLVNTKIDALREAFGLQVRAAREAATQQQHSSDEAIAKAEKATEKAIDQLRESLRTAISGIDAQVGDLKGRIISLEGTRVSDAKAVNTAQTGYTNVFGVVSLAIGSLLMVISLIISAVVLVRESPASAPIIIQGPDQATETTRDMQTR